MLGGMTKFRGENSFDDRRKLCFSLSRCGQLNVSRQLYSSCVLYLVVGLLNIIQKEKSYKRKGSRGRSVHIQLMSREIRASNIHTWICMRCVNTHFYLGDPYMAGRISPDVVNVQASKKECSRRYISLLCFCERVSVWLVTRNVHSSYQRQME